MIRRLRISVTAAVAVVAVLALTCAPALARTVQLDDVMQGQVEGLSAAVTGAGGYYGQCIETRFQNTTGDTITVKVPIGMQLLPANEGVQTMLTAGAETIEVPPGEAVGIINAFCGEKSDGAPGTGETFTFGGFASGNVRDVLENINKDEDYGTDAQAAVWSQTDDSDISNNPRAQELAGGVSMPSGQTAAAGVAAALLAGGAGLAANALTSAGAAAGSAGSSTAAASWPGMPPGMGTTAAGAPPMAPPPVDGTGTPTPPPEQPPQPSKEPDGSSELDELLGFGEDEDGTTTDAGGAGDSASDTSDDDADFDAYLDEPDKPDADKPEAGGSDDGSPPWGEDDTQKSDTDSGADADADTDADDAGTGDDEKKPDDEAGDSADGEKKPPATDVDRALYDPDYAKDQATAGAGVTVDPATYDPGATAGGKKPDKPSGDKVEIVDTGKDAEADVRVNIKDHRYTFDMGGTGLRVHRDRDGWDIKIGDRTPFDQPGFEAQSGNVNIYHAGGESGVNIKTGPDGGRDITIMHSQEDGGGFGLSTGDKDDRTMLTAIRDRYDVTRQFGPADAPTRTVRGGYDGNSGDAQLSRDDGRGFLGASREDGRYDLGWSSSRGRPGSQDDFWRRFSFDEKSGDFSAQWGDVKLQHDNENFSFSPSGGRQLNISEDGQSGTYTWGPSDGSRSYTLGAGEDGGFMAGGRVPGRIGRHEVQFDVNISRNMRYSPNEDMMPQVLPQQQDEAWLGINTKFGGVRGGRVGDDSRVWITGTRRF